MSRFTPKILYLNLLVLPAIINENLLIFDPGEGRVHCKQMVDTSGKRLIASRTDISFANSTEVQL